MAQTENSPMELLNPLSNHNDGNRRSMFNTHILQAVPLTTGEIDKVNSVYGQIAHAGSTYRLAEENSKIFRSFSLFEHEFILIGNLESKNLDIIFINENKSGFMSNSKFKENVEVKKGEVLVEHETTNKLFSIGVTGYTGIVEYEDKTFEDAICISESFAKRLNFIEIKQINFSLKTSEEFVFIDGKPFPDYANGTLCRIRKRNPYNFLSFTEKNMNEPNILRDHKVFEAIGKVSIDVYIHPDVKVPNTRTWNYLQEKMDETIQRIEEFITYVETLIERGDFQTTSTLLANLLNYYRNIANKKIGLVDKKEIKDAIIRVKIVKEHCASDGSKLSNKHGLKGLVKIIPDQEIFDKFGDYYEVIFDPKTLPGRMNMGTIREMQLNKVIQQLETEIKDNTKPNEERINLFRKYQDLCNIQMKLTDEEILSIIDKEDFFLYAIIADRLNIKLLDSFKPKLKKNGITSGYLYFFLLKHEANKKSSAASLPYENTKGRQIRSQKDEFLLLNDSPSKIGHMEMDHLLQASNEITRELILRSSNNSSQYLARKLINEDDLDKLEIEQQEIKFSNSSKELLHQLFISLGIKVF